jgi:hypothetical protein
MYVLIMNLIIGMVPAKIRECELEIADITLRAAARMKMIANVGILHIS